MKREEYIKQLINEKGYKILAEIGVLRGAFSNHLLSTNPEMLILIDPWKVWDKSEYPDYPDYGQSKWDELHDKVKLRYQKNNCNIMRCTSLEAAKQVPNKFLDLAYIDGNHTHDFVLQDLNAWLPKIKKGGTICGHDYQITYKAVEEFCKQHNLQINFVTSEKSTASYFIQI